LSGFDPHRVIDVLARHKVEFVVIGGFAAELYQAPIPPTHDIDITPRMTEPNLARLSGALQELRARVRTEGVPEGLPFSHDATSLARTTMWNLTTDAGDFDLSFRPTGTDGYDDLAGNAVVLEVAGHDVAVAALVDVVRSKTAAGRPKDHATLDTLRQWASSLQGVSVEELRERMGHALRERSTEPGARDRLARHEKVPAQPLGTGTINPSQPLGRDQGSIGPYER